MNSMELIKKLAELEMEENGNRPPGGKAMGVKVRVRCGDHVEVIDLEPGMLRMKEWGSGSEPAVVLLDLS